MTRMNPRTSGTAIVVLGAIVCTAVFASLSPPAAPTITANASFGVAYKAASRGSSEFTCAWRLGSTGARSGRPSATSPTTWTTTLLGYADGDVVVIDESGTNAPLLTSDFSSGTISLSPGSYPRREIQVMFHVESSLDLDTVVPWINDAITVANALFQSERLSVYLTHSTDDAFVLASNDTLDAEHLDALSAPAGAIHVYVASLAAQMFQVGFTSTGVSKIALAAGTQADVLAHELGHNLLLEHPDSPSLDEYLTTNLMVSNATSRTDITEGQTIRAHTHPDSFLAPNLSSPDVQTWLVVWESFWTPTSGVE